MSRPAPRARAAAKADIGAPIRAEPIGAFAVGLVERAATSAGARRPVVAIMRSGRRAEALVSLVAALAPQLRLAHFPAWDCLPYDRAPPSRAVMGQRAGVLRWLTDSNNPPDLVVTTPAALIQRVPPRTVWAPAHLEFRTGDRVDLEAIGPLLLGLGYTLDERVDEPGEAAIRGRVIDLFPAAAPRPCRVEHEDGTVVAIRSYDPATQRSVVDAEFLGVDPASEIVLPPGAAIERAPGMEHWLPDHYPALDTMFDYLAGAPMLLDAGAADRAADFFAQISEAHAGRTDPALGGGGPRPVAPERMFLSEAEWGGAIGEAENAVPEAAAAVPQFAAERGGAARFAAFVAERAEAGDRVVLAAADRGMLRLLARRADADTREAEDWASVAGAEPGTVLTLAAPFGSGFMLPDAGIAVLAAADLLGSRAAATATSAADAGLAVAEEAFRLGDAVIHIDHGMGALDGIERLGDGAGMEQATDAVRLRYAGGATLLVPVDEIGKLWRYGPDAEAVTLDRLDRDSWAARRAEVEAAIGATAARMVELARARDAASAPKLVPPSRKLERFAAGFPYTLTGDQAAAVEAVLSDLASGRPMDRLVCGDVGFGKTEVALRAVAATVFAGKQAAIVAPTTVLARQHYESFRRRFAPFGIAVAQLSRLVKPADAKRVKQGLAEGSVRLVVGTHALAAKGVSFAELGLVVIDEEQRFGAADKAKLRGLGADVHLLTLTATPIPRTLQSALVGLTDLSVIATPPTVRQPVRTLVAPFDAATARDALLRERRRGGQSLVVCPRIEDIAPMAGRLAALAPELAIVAVHGKMPADEIDAAIVDFAAGTGDVLLATNIVESGLDLPNANTILIWRADRFGLAQLHQLRGRVGRAARRGVAYLLSDPEQALPPRTEKRLRALESLDRLGAGFAVSARDLDARGAGDLIGEAQAGHVKLIGLGLYQHLLARAVAAARGEALEEDWTPDLHLGTVGRIPEDYVPEEEVRINLYARLLKVGGTDEYAEIEAEIVDRFGPLPAPARQLLEMVRLRARCHAAGIARLDAGPKAVALTPRPEAAELLAARAETDESSKWTGERAIVARPEDDARTPIEAAVAALANLTRRSARRPGAIATRDAPTEAAAP